MGIATYGKNRTGVGLYLGGETGNEKDAKNQAEINRHYIFHNSSSAEKDYILVNIYKPKHFTGEKQMLLFIQPYNKISRTLKSVFFSCLFSTFHILYKADNWFLSLFQIGIFSQKGHTIQENDTLLFLVHLHILLSFPA